MNRPDGNGEGPGGGQMSRVEYANKMRAEFKQRSAIADQHHAAIREQFTRQFRDFQPPFYSAIRGQGKFHYQLAAEQAATMLVVATKRAPTDSEAAALSEFAIERMNRWVLWKWAMTGVAGYFTYRGASKFRFPFVKQFTYAGKYSPITGPPHLRYAWHFARFVAYYGVTWVMADPLFLAYDSRQSIDTLKHDERLSALRKPRFVGESGNDQASYESQASYDQEQTAQSNQDAPYQASDFSGNTASRAPQGGWSNQSNAPTPQDTDPWSDFSTTDDASPVASPERTRAGSTSNYGSSWDRIRSQSSAQSRPQPNTQQEQSWGGGQSQNSWGTTQGGASWGSNADGQRTSEKDEAQRQFDQLVERERGGTDAQQGSWSRK
ncbi:hypothetical protein HJFPF1_09029 [Paramyrothecium foliicola]|nr:hypothetical protein HJFPF1_09029 [Paramyrothecium foliicola]